MPGVYQVGLCRPMDTEVFPPSHLSLHFFLVQFGDRFDHIPSCHVVAAVVIICTSPACRESGAGGQLPKRGIKREYKDHISSVTVRNMER